MILRPLEFKSFCDVFIDPGEKYFVALFGRKKYVEGIKSSEPALLWRGLVDKKNIQRKVEQLNANWKLRDGRPWPMSALAVYINPNPRDLYTASYKTVGKLAEEMSKGIYRPDQVAMSCIQKHGKRKWIHFDIDTKDRFVIDDIRNIVKHLGVWIETKNGYHLLLQHGKTPIGTWYKDITSHRDVDKCGDQLMPIPGCIQGDFIPKVVNL